MLDQTFDVEVEFSGLDVRQGIEALKNALGEDATQNGYNSIKHQNKIWVIVRDGSVASINGHSGYELVTPILTSQEDIELLQKAVRALKEAGAQVDKSCGLHIHVGAQKHDFKTLQNLIKLYAKHEDQIYDAVDVLTNRRNTFAKKLSALHPEVIERVNESRFRTAEGLARQYYKGKGGRETKYSSARYSGLNLHNIWYRSWNKGTIEFRLFNGTLHAGEIRSYIMLCLALSNKALTTTYSKNAFKDQLDFENFLEFIGIDNSNEMKNVRRHLMKNI